MSVEGCICQLARIAVTPDTVRGNRDTPDVNGMREAGECRATAWNHRRLGLDRGAGREFLGGALCLSRFWRDDDPPQVCALVQRTGKEHVAPDPIVGREERDVRSFYRDPLTPQAVE